MTSVSFFHPYFFSFHSTEPSKEKTFADDHVFSSKKVVLIIFLICLILFLYDGLQVRNNSLRSVSFMETKMSITLFSF